MVSVLLIDDDEFENVVVTRILANHVKYGYKLDYAKSLEEGLAFLKTNQYDYIYLDNELSHRVNATISVERIRDYLNGASLVIISNNLNQDYLKDTSILNVSAIVSKQDLPDYMYNTAA